ncbi:hypothetical protein ACFE04_023213 [Oxalis oulophora]
MAAAIAWPYHLFQTPSLKIDSYYEQSNIVQKISTFPIANSIERRSDVHKCGTRNKFVGSRPFVSTNLHKNRLLRPLFATLNSPKGFGPTPKKSKNKKTSKNNFDGDDSDSDDEEEEERKAGVIPEIVTNRMMTRMAASVGAPLFTGLLFFPFFYYLKTGLKIDVPTWVPFIFSFFFFGTALLGVSYGIVSASWDPMREGSFWGWTEARKNWPVFWQSLRGTSDRE